MTTELDLLIKSYFENDLKSIWRKRYLTFLSNFLIEEEEHDNGIKSIRGVVLFMAWSIVSQHCNSRSSALERVSSFSRYGKRIPEEESFWDCVRIERVLMIRETKTVIPVIEENEMPSPSVVMGHIGTYSWDI
ncbi:8466_t:CDS:2 [Funneliformis geosporum]|uniref:8466_t:CDS:1 n=1 Tax=Funneliformis geosporum TaxID=1117311 RepID=A0A9W4STV4_9GLOM|nr:8466_t:CDS:2 [Funneliformis geosporum]